MSILKLCPLAIAFVTLTASLEAQTLGSWNFEEGTFGGGYGPSSRTVLDGSGLSNHGFRPDTQRRVSYSTDAFTGKWALDLNNPYDSRPNPGQINFFHATSLEPPKGMVEARIKFNEHQDAILLTKATFQFLRREPGENPPTFIIDGEERIVGRTVYDLRIMSNGQVMATIGNDSLLAPGPWTIAFSDARLRLGEWNHVGMSWDAFNLRVYVNGVWSDPVPYEAMPLSGLSYRGTGIDPTYGPMTLQLSISASGAPYSGLIDDVRISGSPCDLGAARGTRLR